MHLSYSDVLFASMSNLDTSIFSISLSLALVFHSVLPRPIALLALIYEYKSDVVVAHLFIVLGTVAYVNIAVEV